MAHVVQEGILYHLYLLGTDGLLFQLGLNHLDIADVTTHTEVFLDLPVLIGGDEVQLHIQGHSVLPAEVDLHVFVEGACLPVVHLRQ